MSPKTFIRVLKQLLYDKKVLSRFVINLPINPLNRTPFISFVINHCCNHTKIENFFEIDCGHLIVAKLSQKKKSHSLLNVCIVGHNQLISCVSQYLWYLHNTTLPISIKKPPFTLSVSIKNTCFWSRSNSASAIWSISSCSLDGVVDLTAIFMLLKQSQTTKKLFCNDKKKTNVFAELW